MVRDAETAIAIGKRACTQRGEPDEGQWRAHYSVGLWEVEHRFEHGDPKCNWVRVKVWADNGKTNPCDICVVAT